MAFSIGCDQARTALMVLCMSYSLRVIFAYNIIASLPLVKIGTPSSQFGYSVSFHITEHGAKILTGAPKGDYEKSLSLTEPGRVFVCDMGEEYDCVETLDKFSHADGKIYNNSLNGFSVCGSTEVDGSAVTCAPRMRHERNEYMGPGGCAVYQNDGILLYDIGFCKNNDPYFDTFGLCSYGFSCALLQSRSKPLLLGAPGTMTWKGTIARFFSSTDVEVDTSESLLPYVKDVDSPSLIKKYSYLGYSVTLGTMDGEDIYFGGAPREDYIGHVLFFRSSTQNFLDYVGRLVGEQFGSYFGASLCLADINNDGQLDLIVGAPFYHETFIGGAIYVYLKKKGLGVQFMEPQKIKSRAMKEAECMRLNCFDARFGWSITSLKDIDHDGYQDIAIGAPFEGKGVVYIFRGSSDGLVAKYAQRIEASEMPVGNRPVPAPFGYSLDSRGVDTDGNSYPDLVVGAFSADSIYLLRTASLINVNVSFQSLPSILDPSVASCPSDGLQRNCFDIRVCTMSLTGQHGLSVKEALVNLTIEAEVYAGALLSRVYFEGKNQKDGYVLKKQIKLNLESTSSICNNYKMYVSNNVKDFLNPIPVRLNYTVDPKFPKYEGNKFYNLAENAMLNGSIGVQEILVDFMKNCGDDNLCISELQLTSELLLHKLGADRYKLLVGLDKEVVVAVEVRNAEEDAHETNVFIRYPETLKYLGANETRDKDQRVVSCSLSSIKGFIVCAIGNPFPSRGKVTFKVRFDPAGILLSSEPLTIEIFSNTTSTDTNLDNNNKTMHIEVMIESDLWISGNSEPENVFFGGLIIGESAMNTEEDIGMEVRHSYEVKNIGKARVPGATLLISWPYELQSQYQSGKHVLYLLDPPLIEGSGECHLNQSMINPLKLKSLEVLRADLDDDHTKAKIVHEEQNRVKRDLGGIDAVLDCDLKTAKCFVINCSIGELRPGQSVVVRLRSRLWNSTFLTEFPKKEVAIRSKGQIVLSSSLVRQTSLDNDVFQVTTYAMSDLRDKAPIPLWIIIASVLAGILFLALLILLLWKLGFFRRKRLQNSGVKSHKAILTKEPQSL